MTSLVSRAKLAEKERDTFAAWILSDEGLTHKMYKEQSKSYVFQRKHPVCEMAVNPFLEALMKYERSMCISK